MPEDEVIFERGKPLKKREDLDLLQIVLADDMARSLKRVEKSQEREEFLGRVDHKDLICTGSVQFYNLLKEHPYVPWAKVAFFNNGPNTAMVSINNAFDWNAIGPNDQLEEDFLKADKRIGVIYYKTATSGQTASVTATGKY